TTCALWTGHGMSREAPRKTNSTMTPIAPLPAMVGSGVQSSRRATERQGADQSHGTMRILRLSTLPLPLPGRLTLSGPSTSSNHLPKTAYVQRSTSRALASSRVVRQRSQRFQPPGFSGAQHVRLKASTSTPVQPRSPTANRDALGNRERAREKPLAARRNHGVPDQSWRAAEEIMRRASRARAA